jgi:hypothetical protein
MIRGAGRLKEKVDALLRMADREKQTGSSSKSTRIICG